MPAPHAIKTLRFELLADAVPQARRLPERFSALCRQQLAVVLAEEFAAHCPPHQQLRLPQLVLELPPIADRRLEAELPDLLRQALRTALGQLSASEKTTITTTPEATSWLAVLEHFLRYGSLPWQIAAGSFSLDEVLRSVVENQAAAFRALLVRLGQTAQRRQRLVWQLNADQLQLLLVVLEPIHAPFLHAYVLATLAAHRRQPLAPVTATALRSIVYELVLADVLLHAGTAFNRRAFLERQVRQLAAQYNLSFSELLRQLVAAELALTPRTQSALSVLLEDLHQRYRPAAATNTAAAPDSSASAVAAGRLLTSGRLSSPDTPAASASSPKSTSSFSVSPPLQNSTAAATARTAVGATTRNSATGAATDSTAASATGAAMGTEATRGAATHTTTAAETGATASEANDFSSNPAAALTYFLQHGSLPLTAPTLTPQQLLAGFPAWLAQGWRSLRPALLAGGPAALQRLARLLPEPLLIQLLRLAVPGQVRPVQGVLEAVWQQPAARAAGHTRPDLWAHTFRYLLRENFQSFSSPVFQQWLTQKLAGATTGQTGESLANSIFGDHASAAGNASSSESVSTARNAFSAGDALAAGNASAVGNGLPATANPVSGSNSAANSDSNPALGETLVGDALAARKAYQKDGSHSFTNSPDSTSNTAGNTAASTAAQAAGAGYYPLAPTGPALANNSLSTENAAPSNGTFSSETTLPTSNATPSANPAAPPTGPATGDAPAAAALAANPVHPAGTGISNNLAAAGKSPAAGNALSLLQAQQVLQYHLAEGTVPPWWPGGAVSPARLRALLAQVLRARPLPGFLRTQPLPAEARQRLIELADFAQLTVLLAARRLPGGSPPPAGAALAALERREATGATGHATGWLLLLRAAYLNFYLDGGRAATATGTGLAEIRRLAARYQLPIPATLGKIRRLLGTQPALLADDFFASLNHILLLPVAAQGISAMTTDLPAVVEHLPALAKHLPTTTKHLPTTTKHLPALAKHLPAPTEHLPATTEHHPATTEHLPATTEHHPTAVKPLPTPQNPSREERNSPREAEESAEAPANPAQTPEYGNQTPERLMQLPTGVAARDLVFYLLRYQRLPWWAPANLTWAQQRQLLTQVAHEYRAGLQALVQAHRAEPAFRQILAELASFAQLARFVAQPGRPAPGRLAPAVLAALDQQLARAGEPVGRLLRQAYLSAAFHPTPADIRTLAAGVRAQAIRTGTAWRTVLRYVAWLHRQLPALAAAPFFAALLAAGAAYEQATGAQQRRAGQRARSRAGSVGTAQGSPANTAFEQLEEYLRTGQAPVFSAGGNADRTAAGRNSATGASTAGTSAASAESVNGNSVAENPISNNPAAGRTTGVGTLPQLLAAQWKLLLRPEHRLTLQPLKPLLASRTVRTRLLAGLAEAGFWQLLRQLYPSHYRLAFRLAADWQLLARQGLVKLSAPALFEVLLSLVQATPVASWRPETVVRALLTAEETLWPQAAQRREYSRAGQLLAAIGRRGLVLRGPLGALLLLHQQAGQVAKPTPPPSTPIPFINEEDRPLETIYLTNAGLVLLWPFLTMLFDRLGYLENQQFRDEASRQRAALLLQFLASGALEVPEYQLPLNKLLCGMPQSQPLPRELALTEAETELGESLLKAVIARWDALKNTSIAGLRETFLLRPGKLDWLPDDRIVLTVEPKTLDILMDRRPWSISIIKLPWMAAPLYVTWR